MKQRILALLLAAGLCLGLIAGFHLDKDTTPFPR